MVTFTGQCLVHRAELLHLHGAWLEAVEKAKRALERFIYGADEFASGDAYLPAGRGLPGPGESVAAEDAYQQASRWGREPQPGLALLRLAQGKTDAAAAAIGRAVAETTDRLRRIKLLPAQVEIMLAAGGIQAALDAADELIKMAGAYSTPALRAMANHARGAVLLASGDAHAALAALRGAAAMARGSSAVRGRASPRAGRTRLPPARRPGGRDGVRRRPAPCSRNLAPHQTSPDRGARPVWRGPECPRVDRAGTAGAAAVGDRHDQSRHRQRAGPVREDGVHRHVSNIFTVDVSSRAAATAYAYQHLL